jgi:hypothetical protein
MNETGDMDALAAEYVLGTLESGERAQALALTTIDPGFAEKIRLWERRLSELHLMVEPIEPDAKIWERIRPKLPGATPVAEPDAEAPTVPEVPEVPEVPGVPEVPDVADEPAPSGVFDELPEPVPETPTPSPVVPAPMPAAPQLPPFRAPPPPADENKPAPAAAVPPPAPAVAPPAIPPRVTVAEAQTRVARPRGRAGLWKALTAILFLIVLATAGLIAAWRFAPDRLPAELRPVEVMRLLGVTLAAGPPPRPPAPPESRYDE